MSGGFVERVNDHHAFTRDPPREEGNSLLAVRLSCSLGEIHPIGPA